MYVIAVLAAWDDENIEEDHKNDHQCPHSNSLIYKLHARPKAFQLLKFPLFLGLSLIYMLLPIQ